MGMILRQDKTRQDKTRQVLPFCKTLSSTWNVRYRWEFGNCQKGL